MGTPSWTADHPHNRQCTEAPPESRTSLRYFDILKPVIRLLATDLDGTFWGPDFVPPPEHVAAVDEHDFHGQAVTPARRAQ